MGFRLGLKIAKITILGCRTEFFFLWKIKLTIVFFGVKFTWDYCNVAIISTLFRYHSQNSKIPNFSSFFYFWPWSRNNYVMIPTTWSFPVNLTPQNYSSKLNFEKKNFRFPQGVSGLVSKSRNRPFWDVGRNFFFSEKKVDYSVFWGEIHWRLPWSCKHFNIISVSPSKFEKSEFFIDFSTFDRDHEIIM